MEDKETTPTKVHNRLDISPSSKNTICVQCCVSVVKADVRRKLFTGASSEKTKACLSLELLLGTEIDRKLLLTEIICRNCFDRNETLVKKILQVREKFESSKTKLRSERSVAYTKRMQKKDSSCVEPVARKSLFETESVVEKPHRAKTLKTRSISTETAVTTSVCMTEKEPKSIVSSVEVRKCVVLYLSIDAHKFLQVCLLMFEKGLFPDGFVFGMVLVNLLIQRQTCGRFL